MFKTDLASLVCTIWEKSRRSLRHPHYDGDVAIYEGMMFELDLELCKYDDNCSLNCRRSMFIACCGNTSVFVAVEPKDKKWHGPYLIPQEAWENSSNHDSCWRTDGMRPITDAYFKMAKTIDPNTAPANLTDHSQLRDFYPVLIHHVREPGQSYRRAINYIKPKPAS